MSDSKSTPPGSVPDGVFSSIQGAPAQRRAAGGARREMSARILLRSESAPNNPEIDGWALNISRGGIRVVIDGRVQLGELYQIEVSDPENPDTAPRSARVVWCQDEPDGAVVGLEFTDTDGGVPSSRGM